MRSKYLASALIFILLSCAFPLFGQGKLEVVTTSGGSVTTNTGHGVAVNRNSSLQRWWVTINDPESPLLLNGAGVNTSYLERERRYVFKPVGRVKAKERVSAFEVRFMLFDVWGEHIKTLSGTEVQDLKADATLYISHTGSWRAWENEVGSYLTAVGFVARVRTAGGRTWIADTGSVLREVAAIKLNLTQESLLPSKERE